MKNFLYFRLILFAAISSEFDLYATQNDIEVAGYSKKRVLDEGRSYSKFTINILRWTWSRPKYYSLLTSEVAILCKCAPVRYVCQQMYLL